MSPDPRLARIARSLEEAGIEVLVMGGHAVRYYGVDRNTNDFDLVTSLATVDELRSRLPLIELLSGIRAQGVWPSHDFARFEIGRLPDGREEWLEFWLRNHLLSSFQDLKSRAERGVYGGEPVSFLGLGDLIRSKETERESDWLDISLLEEVQDSRHSANFSRGKESLHQLLVNLRSRRGMDNVIKNRLFSDAGAVERAVSLCLNSMTHAFFLPLSPSTRPASAAAQIADAMVPSLRSVPFASPRHFTLIEICRRAYKRCTMDIDRADKQKQLGNVE